MIDAIERVPSPAAQHPDAARPLLGAQLARHRHYIAEHLEDMPDVQDWTWASGREGGSRRARRQRWMALASSSPAGRSSTGREIRGPRGATRTRRARDALEGSAGEPGRSVTGSSTGGPIRDAAIADDDGRAALEGSSRLPRCITPPRSRWSTPRRRFPDPAGRMLRHGVPREVPGCRVDVAVPAGWRDRLGVRRYGFHGLSHAYARAARGRRCSAGIRSTCAS